MKRKRIVSVLLTLSMLLSAAPAGFIQAAPDNNFNMVLSDASHGNNRYLTTAGSNAFNVIMYNSTFSGTFGDQHMGGIELMLHGNRIATNGDIHYLPTPEQWDATPAPGRGTKVFDTATNTATVPMTFNYDGVSGTDMAYDIVAEPEPGGVKLSVKLTTDLPADLAGKARFNLEFIPSKYREKSYQAASTESGEFDTFGVFPLHPQDPLEETERPDFPTQAWYVKDWNEDRGDSQPLPFAKGYAFSLAPEDELNNITITSDSGELEMFDGRNRAQNGWYVLSDMITDGKAGDTVVEWHIRPTVQKDWVREPMVAFSQAGYEPDQEKFAVIELDKWDEDYPETATLLHVNADGSTDDTFTDEIFSIENSGEPTNWQRYKYVRFDFTEVNETGMYMIQYGDQKTELFPIADDVYDQSWQSALSGFLAVQMDHIEVREGYKIWHGASHMDDASIVDLFGEDVGANSYPWFDGMSNPRTMPQAIIDKGIEAGKHIAGVNVGGWFDAGDFDIQTNRNIEVLEDLIYAAEAFDNMNGHDTLTVEWDDETGGNVEMHRPDGIPDVVQQVAHGVKQILAQYKILGGVRGTMELRTLRQYTHLGDPSSDTDGYIYDPELGENEIVERGGKVYSGKPDDRVFMLGGGGGSFTSNLLGDVSADFAGAAYVLKDDYPELAEECLTAALTIWEKERPEQPTANGEWKTLLQLMKATKELFPERFEEIKARLSTLVPSVVTSNNMGSRYDAVLIMDLMDDDYRERVETAVRAYAGTINYNTPFGVQWTTGSGWGGSPGIISVGQRTGILYKFFPDVEQFKLYTLRVMNYILGRHPANNTSWLSGVGTKSHLHPYNSNRADESFIPGSILPGHITVGPDIVESMDDFSFLWFENESIINYQSQWISAALAASMIANESTGADSAPTSDFNNDFMMEVKKTSETDGYLETPGFNLFMYNTTFDRTFGDQHSAGIELIQSGRRIATNGDIHLLPTPEQWDATPAPIRNGRTIDEENNIVSADLTIPEDSLGNPAVNYTLTAEPEPGGVRLTVALEDALPEDLVGKAGFNLEFIPSQFIGKSFQADGDGDGSYDKFGVFPLVPEDNMADVERARTEDQAWYVQDWNEDRGDAQPLPIATGEKMTFAAEDDENRIRITSDSGDLELYDGRNRAQNGWFVLRTLIPAGETEIVWHISPDASEGWTREPNVTFNQAGYEPDRAKVAVIELDPNYDAPDTAFVDRLNADGSHTEVLEGLLEEPMRWLRYDYRNFDFSSITEPGMYTIRYAGERTGLFPVKEDAYDSTWQASLSGYLPVQMDHMAVREGYRIWHSPSHMDDALQAPLNTQWFDGWSMGSESDSPYAPYEHIPGLDVGGWYDAGDFDIQTSRNIGVIQDLAMAFDEFGIEYDTTLVDFDAKFVEMHRPDGIADIQQQVKQGILQVLGQIENVGFVFPVLEVPSLRQYTHLGDGSKDTDNRVYDDSLDENEVDGLRSGKLDDRMALAGTKNVSMQFSAAAALASASYVLAGYDDELAERCLAAAEKIWQEEEIVTEGNGGLINSEWNAAIQLLLAYDGESTEHIDFLNTVAPLELRASASGWGQPSFGGEGWKAVRVLDYMDEAFYDLFVDALTDYIPVLDGQLAANPFGVPNTNGMWGGTTGVVDMGVRMSILNKHFPDIVSTDYTFRVMNYILGTHPYTNTSWLSGVGTNSTKIGYGSNRADNYYIAGGIVPGYVNIQPDFPEALDDFGFLWFENEYVIDTAAKWIILANAASVAGEDEVTEVKYEAVFTEDSVSASIKNDSSVNIKGSAIVAVYDENGALETLEVKELKADAKRDTSIEFDIDLSEYPSDQFSYEVFFWDTDFVPLTASIAPPAEEMRE